MAAQKSSRLKNWRQATNVWVDKAFGPLLWFCRSQAMMTLSLATLSICPIGYPATLYGSVFTRNWKSCSKGILLIPLSHLSLLTLMMFNAFSSVMDMTTGTFVPMSPTFTEKCLVQTAPALIYNGTLHKIQILRRDTTLTLQCKSEQQTKSCDLAYPNDARISFVVMVAHELQSLLKHSVRLKKTWKLSQSVVENFMSGTKFEKHFMISLRREPNVNTKLPVFC